MAASKKPPTLVVLQLTGGNDPLNTLVPYGISHYYDQRPKVHVKPDEVLPIDAQFGFHPSLEPIKRFWDDGKMAIVNGTGYEDPSYSHFRSMDIWYTAQPKTVATDGWLGKLVREIDPKADNVLTAVSFGRGLPRALSLAGVPVASVAQLDSYGLLTSLSSPSERDSALDIFSCMYDDGWNDMGRPDTKSLLPMEQIGSVIKYMGQTGLDAQKGADILGTALGKYSSTVEYPATDIGHALKSIAQVKLADLGTRVFYCQHDSFDNHAAQLMVHGKLWRQASEAIDAFFRDLKEHDADDDVIMLLWTEFGRRVRDNGSGTDHGAGGMSILLGESVKGGMYGEMPSLRESDLVMGNLKHNNDFRSTYTSILENWFQVDAKPIVNGSFEKFAFV